MSSLITESGLQWRRNERGSVSNHQPYDCLLNRLFRRRWKKPSKLRVTGLCAGNSPEAGEFPAQKTSNAEKVSIWWRHHEACIIQLVSYRLVRHISGYLWVLYYIKWYLENAFEFVMISHLSAHSVHDYDLSIPSVNLCHRLPLGSLFVTVQLKNCSTLLLKTLWDKSLCVLRSIL